MVVRGKRLIPVELLRRSSRNAKIQKTIETGSCKKYESLDQAEDVKSSPVKLEHVCDVASSQGDCPDGYLSANEQELDLERTLMGGQSFRWTKNQSKQKATHFTGVVGLHALQLWRCDQDRVAFRKLNTEGSQDAKDVRLFLEDYFQLKFKLRELYSDWSTRDENFRKCCKQYTGFRILRQDPVENVFSFICATCNNIKRISQMVEKMCFKFGDTLQVKPEHKTRVQDSFHTFPCVERLLGDEVFQCLRHELGFGYRAKFIVQTAAQLQKLAKQNNLKTPRDYLLSLRQLPYKETCKQLQKLPGIGRKVADCICLMSMDHLGAIPVDCHIYEMFCRNYMPNLRKERKSVTDAVHDLIGTFFTDLHGPLAGWSTSVLFIAELKHLKTPKAVDDLLVKNWSKKVSKDGK